MVPTNYNSILCIGMHPIKSGELTNAHDHRTLWTWRPCQPVKLIQLFSYMLCWNSVFHICCVLAIIIFIYCVVWLLFFVYVVLFCFVYELVIIYVVIFHLCCAVILTCRVVGWVLLADFIYPARCG